MKNTLMRKSFEQSITAVGLVVTMALGTMACGAVARPRPEACTIVVPPDLETRLAMRGLVQAVNDCFDQQLPEYRFADDKPPSTIGLVIPTRSGGKIVVEAQSAAKLPDGKPDPEAV